MTDKLLKIVFIDETEELKQFKFLGEEIYSAHNIFYKFFESYYEISEIARCFENEGYNCTIDNNTIYVIGYSKVLFEKLKENLYKLNETLKDIPYPDFNELLNDELIEKNNTSDEKDIIDKLAEKYRKEAEDKGKLS